MILHIITEVLIIVTAALVWWLLYISADCGAWGNKPPRAQRRRARRFRQK